MKKINLFKMLAVLIVLITSISQMWGYTFYLYTGNFTSWENKGEGVDPKFRVYVNSKDYDFTSLGNHWYSVEVGNASGTAYVKRCRSTDNHKWNEFSADISSSINVAFVSDWDAGYFRPMKTYDGKTYVYWKVAGNSIPSWWYSGTHKVQMLKYTTGYTGYQTGENLGDNIIRYLVPSGTYADIEVQRENANYSGKFSFDTDAAKNIIYNYTEGGGSGSWSTTYFAYEAYIYFDNSAGLLTDAFKSICLGRDNTNKYSYCYTLSNISNTKLWTRSAGAISFNDFDGLRFMGTATEWGEYNGQGPGERTGYTNRSGSSPQLMDHTSRAYNLFWTTSSTNDSELSHSTNSSYAGLLHSTQTVNIQISRDGGSNWITAPNAPAKVTLHSYKLTNATTSTASNATDIAVDATTVQQTTTAVRTATTTVAYESKKVGYTFDGWYRDGARKGTGTSYEYYPVADSTLTARFKAHRYSVVFNGSGKTSGSMDNQSFTYEVAQNLTTNAFRKEGYTFQGWATSPERAAAGTVDYGNGVDGSTMAQATSDNCTVNLYAVWEDDGTYYFDGNDGASTAWATPGNWTKGAVPSSTSDVIILKPVVVTAGTTKTVKSVKIATAGSYTPNGSETPISAAGKLTIPAEAMLVVTNGVQNYNLSTSETSATTAASLHIEAGNTTDAGNGALVWGSSGTPGYATVDFCTKSHGENSANDINQYIGTPFSNNPTMLSQYYNSWMYKIEYTSGVPGWSRISGDATLNDFEGYNLITAYAAGTTYSMEGQLASNADVILNGSSTPALVYNSNKVGDEYKNENVLANSWVAPILIKKFEDGDFTNVEKSIYIFNAGSPNDHDAGTTAGNYTAYSIATIKAAGSNEVIPSMQSFSVYTSGSSPSLTLDYSDLVQENASNSLIEPNLAPKRYTNDKMDLLKVRVEGDNGWADELKVYIREDFSTDFEDGWDAHKMYGYPQAPQLYAVTTDGAMAINCVPTAENNVIGFIPGSKDDEYTFSFEYDGNEDLYLKDNKTGIETPINNESSYSFTASKTDGDMRFVTIKKSPAIVTGIDELNVQDLSVQKILHNGALYIIRDGRIYNAEGALVR